MLHLRRSNALDSLLGFSDRPQRSDVSWRLDVAQCKREGYRCKDTLAEGNEADMKHCSFPHDAIDQSERSQLSPY